jgi:hypothetical protein
MSITPRDFQRGALGHYMKRQFGLALRELNLTLNEASTMDNFKVFKKAITGAKLVPIIELLDRCEKEKMIDLFFAPDSIEEGEDYAFISNGKKMGGTIQKCDGCGKFCYVNGYQVKSFPKGVLPAKQLEDIGEMAGYSEEREQCECESCSMREGV